MLLNILQLFRIRYLNQLLYNDKKIKRFPVCFYILRKIFKVFFYINPEENMIRGPEV